MSARSPVQISSPLSMPGSFGSFDRLPVPPPAPHALRNEHWCNVIGREGSAHQGVIGVAHYRRIEASTGPAIQESLIQISAFELSNTSEMVRRIESGVDGQFAFVVEETGGGDRLSELLITQRRLPISSVTALVTDLANVLRKAHTAGFVHGAVDPFAIVRDWHGKHLLGGFLPTPEGTRECDVKQLAELAITAVVGKLWQAANISGTPQSIAVERLRGEIDGLHEQVAATLIRGTRTEEIDSYGSPLEFAGAIEQSVNSAVFDIIAGAWESISRQDFAMATLLMGMAETYNPLSEELTLLRLQLKGDALRDPAMTAAAIWDARQDTVPTIREDTPVPPTQFAMMNFKVDSFGTGGTSLTPEIEKLLAGPPPISRQGKGLNTWALFGIGVLVMVLIFIVLVAVVFTRLM